MMPTGLHARCGVVVIAAYSLTGCGAADDRIAVPGVEGPTSTAITSTTSTPTTTSTTPAPTTATERPTSTNPTTNPASTNPAIEQTTTSPVVATAPILYLRAGDEGPEVTAIQERLITLEYLAPGGATGVFDRATNSAVLAFQGQYGLLVDGVVGPETRAALAAAAASVTTPG